MKKIWIIIKKELMRFFTDRRVLVGLLMPGILIFIIYSFMGDAIINQMESESAYNVALMNAPQEFNFVNDTEVYEINIITVNNNKEDVITKIKEQEIDLFIVYEEDFYNKMLAYDSSSGTLAPQIEMYFNSASMTSSTMYQYYQSMLMSIEGQIANKFDINALDDIYDLASDEDITAQVLTSIFPFLLLTLLFSGSMSVCSTAIAGEKERGTMSTLLVTPTKRTHIVIGKVVALSITALVSAGASFIGLIVSIPKLIGSEIDVSLNIYNSGSYLAIFGVLISTVLLFTALLSIISTYAKSVKEASSLAVPVMMIVMVVGATTLMSTSAQTNQIMYLIPVYNSVQCIIGVFSMSLNYTCFIITILSNIVYVCICVFILAKMFNSERVMFSK